MNVNPGKTQFEEGELVQLRQEVRALIAKMGISQAELARQADVAGATLSQFLSGTYTAEPGRTQTAQKLHKWMRSAELAAQVRNQVPVKPSFTPMHGSQEIMTILRYAWATGRLVMIGGSPGVSKTSSARQFQAETPRTWYAAMDSTTNGIPAMLPEILFAMGLTDVKGPPHVLIRLICQKAQEAKGLLIIDEAQHLSDKAIEALRAINDRVGLGIAVMGNEAAWNAVGPTGVKMTFAQVSSRFAHRRFLPTPDPRDAATLAQAWGASNGETITPDLVAFSQEIARKPGGLRNIEMTFEKALLACRAAGEPLELGHLQGAFAQQSGIDRR